MGFVVGLGSWFGVLFGGFVAVNVRYRIHRLSTWAWGIFVVGIFKVRCSVWWLNFCCCSYFACSKCCGERGLFCVHGVVCFFGFIRCFGLVRSVTVFFRCLWIWFSRH